jgi:hypothetical protein
MIIRNIIIFIISIIIVVGCSTTIVEKQKKDDIAPSDLSACRTEDEAAQIMVEGILHGLQTRNYNEFTKDFASRDKTPFSKKAFEEACIAVDDNLGILLSKQYLGSINKIGYSIALWKAKYSKAPEDIVFEMYIIRENNTFKVSAFIPK